MDQLAEIFDSIRKADHLVSGMFSDALDKLGHPAQVAAGWKLNQPRNRMLGRARTLTIETIETSDEHISAGLTFLGRLEPSDVLVVKGSDRFAYFGELMTRLSMERRLGGIVIDGLTRDSFYTSQVSLPIFARGYSPVDIKGRGRVSQTDVPISVANITVTPGDLVFGDSDAVVFVPQAMTSAVVAAVCDLLKEETRIKRLIADGMSIPEILKSVTEF